MPAALAVYELHVLLGSSLHAGAALHWFSALSLGSATPWLLLALALAAGALLRESARGLFAALAVGALAAGTLGGHAHLLSGGLGSFSWVGAPPVALLAGLVLTDVGGVVRWLLRALARLRPQPPHLRLSAPPVRHLALCWRPIAAPLLTGWSDRGPPTAAPAAASL